jgi:type II secretory pathway pseudopilin PulG
MTSGERSGKGACGRPSRERGMGYLLVLFSLAAIGIGLATTGQVWRTSAQREREAQLLFVGQQFRLALASYRDASAPGVPIAPATLAELIEDRRQPTPRTHLRRLWSDPMTGDAEWGLVRVGGRIVAVHSRDQREPIRTAFAARDADFVGAASYAQWVFMAAEARNTRLPIDPAVSPNAARSPP